MDSKSNERRLRGIALLVLLGAGVGGVASGAEAAGVRMSAPALGWLLSPDGSQLIELTGISESPRVGDRIGLAAPGRQSWAAPDASRILVRLDRGLALIRAGGPADLLLELDASIEVAVAWDRGSAGFAVCWGEVCESRTASGVPGRRWEAGAGAELLAYSSEWGVVVARKDGTVWLNGSRVLEVDVAASAAAFRPGTDELWLASGDGRLTGLDENGQRIRENEWVGGVLGLCMSADGQRVFGANANGEAAVALLTTGQVERTAIDGPIDGVWAAPGAFAVRLHGSAKRPVGIWNGETGVTAWAPVAVEGEVAQ